MKTVIEMARDAGIEWDLIDKDEGQIWYITQAGLVRFAELVRADEREACAKVCDVTVIGDEYLTAAINAYAAAIRARGEASIRSNK